MKKFAFLCFITSSILFSCSSNDSRQDTGAIVQQIINSSKTVKINEFIMSKVKSHQVVLLGENRHNQYIYHQKVIELLNYWLKQLENNEDLPGEIGLILEQPQYFGQKLNSFLSNGDISQLAYDSHFVLNATVADLELFQDLKNLNEQIKNLNKDKFKGNPVAFKVICVEKDIPMMAGKEVRDNFFQTERDIYTAHKIEEKITSLPSYRFIGTFGAFHIAKRRDSSNNIPRLAHELQNGGVKIYTIDRRLFSENRFGFNYNSEQEDFALPLNAFDKFNFAVKSDDVDACIFYNASYFNDILVNNIPSINLIRNYLDYAKQYPGYYSSLFWLWYRFTGEMVGRGENLIDYIEIRLDSINTTDLIDKMTLFENIFNIFEKLNVPGPEIKSVLVNLTGYSEYKEIHFIPDDSSAIEYWKDYVDNNREKIKVRLFTSVLYYGTESEQSKALEKLKQLTGKNFNTKKEWLNWYRRKQLSKNINHTY